MIFQLTVTAMVMMLVVSCASSPSMPVPKMKMKDASGIALFVEINTPLGWPTKDAMKVYFIKVDDNNGFLQASVISSNYAYEGRVYLLNIPPGDYVAVAAWHNDKNVSSAPANPQPGLSVSFNPMNMVGRIGWNTYFSEKLIAQTRIRAEAGQVVCAGHYTLDTSMFGDDDPAQAHYRKVILGGIKWMGSIGEVKRDATTKLECIKSAKIDLAQGGWSELLNDEEN